MIEIKNITKSFDDKKVLHGISGKFEKGKTNLIIGASGTGKSVLLKCLVGLLSPDNGKVLFDGRYFTESDKNTTTQIRREIGMLFQGSALFDSKNVEENMVRINQTSIGINYIDTYHRTGIYPLPLEIPFCLGVEAAGDVIEIGDNVSNLKVGDRVAYSFSPPIGAYCEVRDFDAQRVVKLPEYISNDEAASILLQGMTVEYLFERLYKLQKDEVFFISCSCRRCWLNC